MNFIVKGHGLLHLQALPRQLHNHWGVIAGFL
jgi:hypothetical protein